MSWLRTRARPKSPSLTLLLLSRKTLAGFKSRCRTVLPNLLRSWHSFRADMVWVQIFQAKSSSACPLCWKKYLNAEYTHKVAMAHQSTLLNNLQINLCLQGFYTWTTTKQYDTCSVQSMRRCPIWDSFKLAWLRRSQKDYMQGHGSLCCQSTLVQWAPREGIPGLAMKYLTWSAAGNFPQLNAAQKD